MNNKERLQEIKRNREFPQYCTNEYGNEEIYYLIINHEFDWLVEQAEKAIISEELLDRQRTINMRIKLKYTKQKQQLQQAKAKIERYEKALKQIASHYLFTENSFDCDLEANELIYKAQEALEGEE
jgi:5-bromo-4-chloroindolyl phosphate hydrolysis protein